MVKVKRWFGIFGLSLAVWASAAWMPENTIYAATEPTFEVTEETSDVEAYIGEVRVSELNVRTGMGANYDKVNVNGTNIKLHTGDRVAILSSGNSEAGDLWYEVRWIDNDMEYHGYVNASYVNKLEERATPLPTPTPEATPTPEPTPTPEVTSDPELTETPSITQTPSDTEGKFSVLEGVGIIVLLLLLIIVTFVIIILKKREAQGAQAAEKIDSLKNIPIKKRPEDVNGNPINIMKRKEGDRQRVGEAPSRAVDSSESDAVMLAKKEQAKVLNQELMKKSMFYDPEEEKRKEEELKNLSDSLKEKELLKEEIDSLTAGDMVYHEYFGKGVVFDNSDIKKIEIRFGADVRYIDKAGCVAKKLMRKV